MTRKLLLFLVPLTMSFAVCSSSLQSADPEGHVVTQPHPVCAKLKKCCPTDQKAIVVIPCKDATFTAQGVSAFAALFQAAAAKGVENATIRAMNATTVCPNGDCKGGKTKTPTQSVLKPKPANTKPSKPTKKPANTKPATKPSKPTKKPAAKPSKPTKKPANTKPAAKPSKQTKKPTNTKPATKPSKQTKKPTNTKPATKPSKQTKKPATKPSKQTKKPATKPSKQTKKPANTKPATKPSKQTKKPANTKPATKPSKQTKKPANTKPATKPSKQTKKPTTPKPTTPKPTTSKPTTPKPTTPKPTTPKPTTPKPTTPKPTTPKPTTPKPTTPKPTTPKPTTPSEPLPDLTISDVQVKESDLNSITYTFTLENVGLSEALVSGVKLTVYQEKSGGMGPVLENKLLVEQDESGAPPVSLAPGKSMRGEVTVHRKNFHMLMTTSQGQEVDLHSAGDPWADNVVSYAPGKPQPYKELKSNHALHAPDYKHGSSVPEKWEKAEIIKWLNATPLSKAGKLTLQFTDNALFDGDGDDLAIFEIGNVLEAVKVSISKDGKDWVDIGEVQGGKATLDIGPHVKPNELFRFVRLTDNGKNAYAKPPHKFSGIGGADIDAVGAINSIDFFSDPAKAPRLIFKVDSTEKVEEVSESNNTKVATLPSYK